MIALMGALTLGLILGFLALGTYITFRVFSAPDITVDGSITLGGAVTAALIANHGMQPGLAMLVAMAAGMLAGSVTALLSTRFRIHTLLAGILVMTGLYSINLHIMGKSNIPLIDQPTVFTQVRILTQQHLQLPDNVMILGHAIPAGDLTALGFVAALILISLILLRAFLRTNLGLAMRATGDNEQMIKALGAGTERMQVLGFALANGLVALAGSLLVQNVGFADVQMGMGMVVTGMAALIIGQTLVNPPSVGYGLLAAVLGAVLFRLVVAVALSYQLDPNNLKLVTAVFVAAALIAPLALGRLRNLMWRVRPS